jgi:hypothetical protein
MEPEELGAARPLSGKIGARVPTRSRHATVGGAPHSGHEAAVIYHQNHPRVTVPHRHLLRNRLRARRIGRGAGFAVRRIRSSKASVAIVLALTLVSVAGCPPSAVGSVGAVLSRSRESGAVHVRETPEGYPAERTGVLPGDRVKMVDGVLVDELDAERIRALLRGPVDSKVMLTLIRGDEVLHVEIRRSEMGKRPPLPPANERIE